MKKLASVMIIMTALAAYSRAADPVETPEVSDEKAEAVGVVGRLASLTCVSCHGAEGMSGNEDWPNLAGQQHGYLVKQITDFRDGGRHDPWMSPMARPLSDEDIAAVADYFNALPPTVDETDWPDALPEAAEACMACHGESGLAENDMWPNLAGQNREYLAKQLKLFRDGVRSDEVMTPMVEDMSNDVIEGLADFFSSLKSRSG